MNYRLDPRFERLKSFLFERANHPAPQWMITKELGLSGPLVRKMANAHPQTIIGTSEGYLFAAFASTAVLEDTVRVLMSRAEKILHRARSVQRLAMERRLKQERMDSYNKSAAERRAEVSIRNRYIAERSTH